ncbi:DUF1616 domain-containing protein [Yinghuangia soli]|uniref:DUF1616 domain-containing protein n=1 Tax=Yinghuangia soli TaxID=2908204 RepID=A0AA41U4Z4_9ACTN|nr:DUF1616 domain-containing protein [Yinghuangia soli]MCF2533491.1 DUF1616 domain-containing protein [Yinghuangia soli]
MLYRLTGWRHHARRLANADVTRWPWHLWTALLAGAWLLAWALHAVRADVVSAALAVLGTAALLRTGSTLLDRFVPALGLLCGIGIAFGLVVSVWPWGMAPFPIAGCAFTGLLAAAKLSRRTPRLPRKWRWSDSAMVLAGAAAGATLAWPTLGGGAFKQVLPYMLAVGQGDRMRHFTLFDAIQQSGGYTFVDVDSVRDILQPGMESNYPSGMHFLYALADTFVRSGRPPGAATTQWYHYYLLAIAGYVFFVVCTVWACRWVAGPVVKDRLRTIVCLGVGTYLCTGALMAQFWNESDAEILGLALFALLAAFIARPPVRPAEHAILVAALFVAVASTYSLFVVPAALCIVVGLVCYRTRVRRSWQAYLWPAVVALPFALVPVVVPRLIGTLDVGGHLLLPGPITRMQRRFLIPLGIVVVVGLLWRRTRRSTVYQAMLGQILAATAALVCFWGYQMITAGHTLYYFEKALHAWAVLCLIGIAPIVLRWRRDPEPRTRPAGRGWRTAVAAGTVVAVVAVAGGLHWGRAEYAAGRPVPDANWGATWASGEIKYPYPLTIRSVAVLSDAGFLGDGVPTLSLLADDPWRNVDASNIAAVLNHQYGLLKPVIDDLSKIRGMAPGPPRRPAPTGVAEPVGPLSREARVGLARLKNLIEESPVPLRIVVWDPSVERALRAFAETRPELGLTVVRVDRLGDVV